MTSSRSKARVAARNVEVIKVGDKVMLAAGQADTEVACGILLEGEIGVVVHLGWVSATREATRGEEGEGEGGSGQGKTTGREGKNALVQKSRAAMHAHMHTCTPSGQHFD